MKQFILFVSMIIFSISGFSQQVLSNSNVKVQKVEMGKTEGEVLDKATVRCYYKFIQPVTIKDKHILQTDTMTMDIGVKITRYYDAARIKRDSIFGNMLNNKLNPSAIQSISVMKDADMSTFDSSMGTTFESTTKGETSQLYKKRQEGEMITIDRAENSRQKYKCTEKVTSQKWNITTDTLTILGYTCQKAITHFRGRDYEAWFSPDIPMNDGPWKFYGLPGLILKVSDIENQFLFETIGLEHLSTPVDIIMLKEDYIKCDRKEIEKLKKKRSGGMGVNINGGNIVMIQKKNNSKYLSLEIE